MDLLTKGIVQKIIFHSFTIFQKWWSEKKPSLAVNPKFISEIISARRFVLCLKYNLDVSLKIHPEITYDYKKSETTFLSKTRIFFILSLFYRSFIPFFFFEIVIIVTFKENMYRTKKWRHWTLSSYCFFLIDIFKKISHSYNNSFTFTLIEK